MFAKVTYGGFVSYHPNDMLGSAGVCCHKAKLKRMARAYIKQGSYDKEALRGCQELYTTHESELEHLNRKRQFALFCTFVKSQPDRETLLNMQADNVCPIYVEQVSADTDTAIVQYFKDKWYIPRPTKEERMRLREERKARRLARQQARQARMNQQE